MNNEDKSKYVHALWKFDVIRYRDWDDNWDHWSNWVTMTYDDKNNYIKALYKFSIIDWDEWQEWDKWDKWCMG